MTTVGSIFAWAATVLTAVTGLLAVMTASFVGWVRYRDAWFAAQPVRSAWRAAYGRRFAGPPEIRTEAKSVRTDLVRAMRQWSGSPQVDDVAIFADVICRPAPAPAVAAEEEDGAAGAPYRSSRFTILARLVAGAVEPRRVGLVVRYLLADRWAQNRQFLVLLDGYCAQFRTLQTVSYPRKDPAKPTALFAEIVSAMSGAVVVADMSAAKAGGADRVVAWHSRDWRGRHRSGITKAVSYERPYVRYSEQITSPTPGRYNGRVPILLGVELAQPRGSDGLVIALHTAESDYFSTEPPKPYASPPQGTGVTECKKLPPACDDCAQERFGLLEGESEGGGRQIGARVTSAKGTHRGTLLNGKVALVSVSDGDAWFILMQRSTNVSNAAGGLAQTAGGVAELAVEGDRRDADEFGAVDVVAAIRREMQEELGVRPSDCHLSVKAVFLANSRTKPIDRSRPDTGELVATVLAVGTTTLDVRAFAQRRLEGSQSRGLYESNGLLFVPMGKSADDFARNIFRGRYRPADPYERSGPRWCGLGFGGGIPIENDLEQAAFVAAMYASEMRYGQQKTVAAFKAAAGEAPWWSRPWHGRAAGARSRIVRDPASLVADSAGTSPFARWVQDLWGQELEGLLSVFQEDCRHPAGRRTDHDAESSSPLDDAR